MRFLENGRGLHPLCDTSAKQLWRFDQTGATDSLSSLMDTGITLAHSGSPPAGSAPVGTGRSFDRTTPQYFNQTSGGGENAAELIASGFTIAFLCKPASGYANHGYVVSYARGGGPSLSTNMVFGCRVDSDLRLSLRWQYGAGGTEALFTSTDVLLKTTEWSLVVWTYDGAGTLKLYVNGSLAQTWTGLTGPETDGLPTQRYAVGVRADNLTTSPFEGHICSVLVERGAYALSTIEDMFWRAMAWVYGTTIHWRVTVVDGDGAFSDLSSLGGLDWLLDVQYEDDVDAVMATAKVTCIRDSDRLSLAKYHDSKLNRTPLTGIGPGSTTYTENTSELIALNRRAKVYFARMPLGAARPSTSSGDWELLLDGRINNAQWPNDTMVISIRDEIGHRLIKGVIRTKTTKYGSAATPPTTTVQSVMQSVLTDGRANAWYDVDPDTGGATTLFTPSAPSPAWNKYEYTPEREPYITHLNWLADHIGWKCKSRFRRSTGKYELTFYEPERTRATPHCVIPNTLYHDLSGLEIDDANIRNVIRVIYKPHPSDESADPGAPSPPSGFTATHGWDSANDSTVVDGQFGYAYREWKHTASITKYGEIFGEFTEGSTSGITKAAEADTLCLNALRDIAEPKMEQRANALLFPELEVGDIIRWKGYAITGTAGSGAQGHTPYTGDQTLAVVSLSHNAKNEQSAIFCRGTPCSGHQTWLDKDTSRSGGALPPVMAGSHVDLNMADRFKRAAVMELIQGTSFVRSGRQSLGGNMDFGNRRYGDGIWDCWRLTGGAFGTNIFNETTTVRSGRNAVKMTSNTAFLKTGGRDSNNWLPVEGSKTYSAESWTQSSAGATVQMDVEWYDSAKNVISSSQVHSIAGATGAWRRYHSHISAPSTARWARIFLSRPGGSGNIFWDRVNLCPIHPMARAYQASTTPVGFTSKTWLPVTFDTESYDYDAIFDLANDRVDIDVAGKWTFSAGVMVYPNTTAAAISGQLRLKIVKAAGGTIYIYGSTATNLNTVDGVMLHVNSGEIVLARADQVSLEVYGDDLSGTPAPEFSGDSDGTLTWLSCKHVTQEG